MNGGAAARRVVDVAEVVGDEEDIALLEYVASGRPAVHASRSRAGGEAVCSRR